MHNEESLGGFYGIIGEGPVYDQSLTPMDVRVYAALRIYAQRKDRCWPSQATIASRMGVSMFTVCRSINHLRQAGWVSIKKIRKDNKEVNNEYYFSAPGPDLRQTASQDLRQSAKE